MTTDAKLVTIYPTGDFHIPGVPAVEQDVTPKRARELLAYRPPAFTTDPPAKGTMEGVGSSDTPSDTMPTSPGS